MLANINISNAEKKVRILEAEGKSLSIIAKAQA
jgi:hypothetical protein